MPAEIRSLHRLFEIVDALVLQGAQRLKRLGYGPSGIRVHAEHDCKADGFPDRGEVLDVFAPALRMAGFHAEHLDAELADRPFRIGDHFHVVVRHADGPFERNAFLREAADEIIDRLAGRLAERIMERMVDSGAGEIVERRKVVEQDVQRFEIEEPAANQAGPAHVLHHGDHAGIGVRYGMMRCQGPDLPVTDDAFGIDLYQHGLAQQLSGSAGVVSSGRSLTLKPRGKIGYANFNPFNAHAWACRSSAAIRRIRPPAEITLFEFALLVGPSPSGPTSGSGYGLPRRCSTKSSQAPIPRS